MSRGGDRDAFFHCLDRVPSGLHIDADFPSDEDDDDVRLSFASAMGDQSAQSFRRYQAVVLEEEDEEEWEAEDPSMYDMWMSDDMSIQERRRHLHQGLGMASSRDLALRRHSMKKRPADIVPRSVSRRLPPPSPRPVTATSPEAPPPSATATPAAPVAAGALQPARAITRRHSDTSLAVRDGGDAGKPALALRRVRSLPARHAACDSARAEEKAQQAVTARELPASSVDKCCEEGRGDDMQGSGGKEVAAVAAAQQQSGVPGLEEIEKFNGNTPIMKHLVRRGTSQHQHATPPKGSDKSAAGKKGGWLKNIKSVAIGFIHDKDTANAKPPATSATATTTAAPKPAATTNAAAAAAAPAASSSERLKVHQSGKSSKELTGLDMCQVLMGMQQAS
jgi:WD repeat-containing protein 44